MHRSNLLHLLEDYRKRYPAEAHTVDRYVDFVAAHEDCFLRTCIPGHVTGSAWLLHPDKQAVLLTHHKKLNMWLQLGGHADGESNVLTAAQREAEEESGLSVAPLASEIFDVDIHEIPARKHEPAHLHYDIRFALRAESANFTVSDESHDLAWALIAELERYTTETSIMRMRTKWGTTWGDC